MHIQESWNTEPPGVINVSDKQNFVVPNKEKDVQNSKFFHTKGSLRGGDKQPKSSATTSKVLNVMEQHLVQRQQLLKY